MLDIRWIRDHPDALDAALKSRGEAPAAADVVALDEERRAHKTKLQDAQTKRNAASKEIGAAKASGDKERAEALIREVAEIKSFLQSAEDEERRLDEQMRDLVARLPNVPLDDVPVGPNENTNLELRRWGEPRETGSAKQHFELGEELGQMDFEAAARIAGARFVVLKGGIARLHRALGQFMIDLHTSEHGYEEIAPPLLVRSEAMFGTAQLPKFGDDSYETGGYWLIPTAEVSLTNLVREEVLDAAELPMRVTALTPCFRSEAGSAGRDTRGMLRQHQFEKCELVSIVDEESGLDELERMTRCAETVLERLELPYRTMVLSTGDMGFAARRTHDIEVWLPGQGSYREISSCSFCSDFQARRMNARYRNEDGPRFVHTLNGSGVAVGRTLIAVMENHQQPDGSIAVPDALRRYTGGLEKID